jgi:transposase
MIRLEFSESTITALEYERYHHPHPHVQRKMEVLYLKSQGLSHQEIRRLCRIKSKTTLVTYLREYEAGGITALKQLNFKGSPSQLNEHIPSLKAHFAAHPPRTSAEAGAEIERLTGIKRSPTQIKAFLKRIGLKPRKVGYVPGKAATAEKMAEQDSFQTEKLEPRLAEAQAGERALFLWMLPTLSIGPTWAFFGVSAVSSSPRHQVVNVSMS